MFLFSIGICLFLFACFVVWSTSRASVVCLFFTYGERLIPFLTISLIASNVMQLACLALFVVVEAPRRAYALSGRMPEVCIRNICILLEIGLFCGATSNSLIFLFGWINDENQSNNNQIRINNHFHVTRTALEKCSVLFASH